jgi:two-component system, cell cycle sensor histidine kinase and response regulator CckA
MSAALEQAKIATDELGERALRLLIVEDSENDAELLLREFSRNGYRVTSLRVESAAELRRALAEQSWDVIVSDYSLPSFDAPRALAVLKETGLDIPFVVVSGTIGEESAVDALKAGAHDFLAKARLARLVPAIERELREVRVRDARRHAERALRESEHRYRRIIETTSDGVWVLDASSVTTFVNARMANLLGRSVEDVAGRPLLDFVQDDCRAQIASNLERREACIQVETTLERPDAVVLWVLLDSTPIFDASRNFEGTLVMATDITARKQLEEQLRHAQKMDAVGSLAGGVAHDFNNLLSIILSCSTLVLQGLRAGDPIRTDLEEIRKAGERAADLTRQLLAFSRRQVFELKILDLNQVLAGMRTMLRRLLPEHIELSLVTTSAIGKVRADRGQMEQVIMNLVVNARDAMPHGGKIVIETADAELDAIYAASHLGVTPGRYVTLAVTDTGTGMDAATRARIFEPFFTTKEQGKGTGLGLATVFGIVQQSGGHIWVHSELGKGSRFELYLPRTEAALDTLVTFPPVASTSRCNETILLVEDEDGVRAVARTMLRRQGYTVLEAQNGGEAFLACEQYHDPIHLLITDVIMPRMSGRELAERLAPIRPEMKVLYVSGYTEDAVVHNGGPGSGSAFLQKPITPDVFLRKVRDLLDAPHRMRPRRV